MRAQFISSCYKNKYYLCLDERMDRQTDGKTTQTGRNILTHRMKQHGLDIHVSTDGKQGQTGKLDGPTNGRTG